MFISSQCMDGKPMGFAKVKINSLNENIESMAQMELQKIYVLPEFQGMGIGSALLNEVRQLACTISPDYLWLDTHTSNKMQFAFMKRMVLIR